MSSLQFIIDQIKSNEIPKVQVWLSPKVSPEMNLTNFLANAHSHSWDDLLLEQVRLAAIGNDHEGIIKLLLPLTNMAKDLMQSTARLYPYIYDYDMGHAIECLLTSTYGNELDACHVFYDMLVSQDICSVQL